MHAIDLEATRGGEEEEEGEECIQKERHLLRRDCSAISPNLHSPTQPA